MDKIQIVLVDDHAMVRAGLKLLIHSQNDMVVIGEGANHEDAVHLTQKLKPEVIILDLSMPGGGNQLIEKITRLFPQTKVLVLTMHDDPAYVRLALASGASGFVVKKAADTELLNAIRTISKGGIFAQVPQEDRLVRNLTQSPQKKGAPTHPLSTLSEREKEVLMLLAQGYTNQAIAEKKYLSVKTVESYRSRLVAKLGLKNRAEVTRFVLENGLLSNQGDLPAAGETPADF